LVWACSTILATGNAEPSTRIDRIETRLDRIERLLDLVPAATF
jgi:hypothetical protein